MKIIELRTENVMRLTAAHVAPDGALVVISGKNKAGKTSLIDSIAMALGGKELVPGKPLRKGAKRGSTRVTIGDKTPELIVTRSFDVKGGTQLKVENAEGAPQKSPQKLLNELVGPLSFDPLKFMRMKAEQQTETLRKLVGLDFTEIDNERIGFYEDRTHANRDVSQTKVRLADLPPAHDVPERAVSIASIATELEAAEAEMRRRTATQHEIDDDRRSAQDLVNANVESEKAYVEMESRMLRIRDEIKSREGSAALLRERAASKAAELEGVEPIDTAEIRDRLVHAEATNIQVSENQVRAAAVAELRTKMDAAEELSQSIEDIDERKADMIAQAEMPIPGLAFDETGITLDGVPFDQASGAEQLATSVAMGLAMNPKLKILLIRDGSLLDVDNRALVAEMAEKANAQVWMECVEENESTSVVIVDGTVREEEAAEPAKE